MPWKTGNCHQNTHNAYFDQTTYLMKNGTTAILRRLIQLQQNVVAVLVCTKLHSNWTGVGSLIKEIYFNVIWNSIKNAYSMGTWSDKKNPAGTISNMWSDVKPLETQLRWQSIHHVPCHPFCNGFLWTSAVLHGFPLWWLMVRKLTQV